MRLFGEEVKHTSTNSPLNILQVENFEEIFFDVFEVELNDTKLPLEKISEYKGNPVVNLPIVVDGEEVLYPFVLSKGTPEILFSESNLDLPIDDEVLELVDEDTDLTSESKQEILDHIERAKQEAKKAIKQIKLNEAVQLSEKHKKNNKALNDVLEKARGNLVSEFLIISDNLRKEFLQESRQEYSEIKETIDNKLADICKNLESQLKENFEDSSRIFDTNIKSLVKELYSETVYPKLENDLNDIALQIVEKVEEIENNLDKKLDNKAEKTLVEGVSKELSAIQKANIELNDNINKGINKALSRAGNVKTLVEKIDKEINTKISTELTNIENYFDERIQNIQEKTFDITEESRKYIIDLVNKSKTELLEEIKKIPKEKPVEYIIESKSKNPEKVNLDKLKKEYDSIIHNKFENYKTDLRKYIAVYSGGGSVAQQFADGGTMNGNLVVVGSISASQYLGLSSTGGGTDTLDTVTTRGNTTTNSIEVVTLSADAVKFDTTAVTTSEVGKLKWNDAAGTLDLGLKGGSVTLQVGQEQIIRVVNKTGVDLLRSQYSVVHVAGATGQRLSVHLSQATNDANSATTIGVVSEDIANNQEGFITTSGQIHDINTTGSLQGETWSDGDALYLSPTTAGHITNVKPLAPYHTILIGFVEYAHAIHGKIFVHIQNGYELEELHNVSINLPANGDSLIYNSLSGIWINSNSKANLSGGNVFAGSQTFTSSISALSASIANNFAVDTNTLFVDATNNRVGVGTITPSSTLHTYSFSNSENGILIENAFSGSFAAASFYVKNDIGTVGGMVTFSNTYNLPQFRNRTAINSTKGLTLMANSNLGGGGTDDIRFYVGGYNETNEKMRILPNGNVGIGVTNPATALSVAGNITSTEVVGAASNLTLRAFSGNGSRLSISSATVAIITNSGFRVELDNDGFWATTTTQLGKSTNRWSTIWGTNANISTTLTVGTATWNGSTFVGAQAFTNAIVANGQGTLDSAGANTVATNQTLDNRVHEIRPCIYAGVSQTGGTQTTAQYANTDGSLSWNNVPLSGQAAMTVSWWIPIVFNNSGDSLVSNTGGQGGFIDWRANHASIWNITTPWHTTAQDIVIKMTIGSTTTSGTNSARVGSLATNNGYGIRIAKHPTNNTYEVRLMGRCASTTANISNATNATPVVITHNNHGYQNGDLVEVSDVGGNTGANGIYTVSGVTTNTYVLDGSVGNGAYTSGGSSHRLTSSSVEINPYSFYRLCVKWNSVNRTITLHLNNLDQAAVLTLDRIGMPYNVSIYQTSGIRLSYYSVTNASPYLNMSYGAPTIYKLRY